jgi:anti-sigma factor ChrR (cupin superfamily)
MTELEGLAALDAAGALTDEESREYRVRLSKASAEERAAIAHVYDLIARAAVAGADETPGPAVRDRLKKVIEGSRIYSVLAGEGQWGPGPVAGTRIKLLSVDRVRRSMTMLMRVEPGARYPPHHHSGGEDCYVISGASSFTAGISTRATSITPRLTAITVS